MQQYFTAELYRQYNWCGEPYLKNGKMYVEVFAKCSKCGGTGNSPYVSTFGGVCLRCHGTGTWNKEVRVYTKQEIEKQNQIKMQKKKQKQSEKIKTWLQKHNFDENGYTYFIIGTHSSNTYEIKDYLKQQGCYFNAFFGWHIDRIIDLPDDYKQIPLHYKEIYEWNNTIHELDYKADAKQTIDKMIKQEMPPSESRYVGTVGDRIHNITAIFKSVRGFNGAYGWTNIYTFESEKNVFVWFTTKNLKLTIGDVVDFTGTIKKHEAFRGVQTTVFSRCVINVIK